MRVSSLPKSGIRDVRFGYLPKRGGYTTLMSDIPKLDEMLVKVNRNRLHYESYGGSITK